MSRFLLKLPPIASFQLVALVVLGISSASPNFAQSQNPFRPFTWEWPTPSETRLATGAPGPLYWQQKANYDIAIRLDEVHNRIDGSETLVYVNQSPHTLPFLWIQLDQNLRKPDALVQQMQSGAFFSTQAQFDRQFRANPKFEGGMEALKITSNGQAVPFRIVETSARIDLPHTLLPGESIALDLTWSYALNDARDGSRSGYEYFPEDGNYIYEIAQFYPRVCSYDDLWGWENQPFLGDAEFGLEFGDFKLAIDVPAGFLVTATGELQNEGEVLTKEERLRLTNLPKNLGEPQFIVSPKEALAASKEKVKGRKVWRFSAENVRDVAFAASRKFIWEAAVIDLGGKKIRTQAFYPKEGMPLWDKFATHAIIHTLQTYSKLTFDYPYPVATAVHGPVWGMEYPMLAFCGGRPTSSGYYSRQSKYRMIGVVIHEVGHNYFPMVVNSNERRYAWMDEGLNSFCQIIAEESFEEGFLLRRGSFDVLDALMKSDDNQPIMTSASELRDNSTVSYHKTALGLRLLHDEVLGPELFSEAFQAYAKRWKYKHPEPADFFRTIEDLSGFELSWFWRTWFYENVQFEYGISKVKHYSILNEDLTTLPKDIHEIATFRETPTHYYATAFPDLKDRYTDQHYDEVDFYANDLKILLQKGKGNTGNQKHLYQIMIERKAAGILPLQMEAWFADGSSTKYRIPAQAWIKDNKQFVKDIYTEKQLVAVILDPSQAMPDMNRENNIFPRERDNLYFEEVEFRQ